MGPSNPEVAQRGRRVSSPYQGNYPEKFKMYLRMSVDQFDDLLEHRTHTRTFETNIQYNTIILSAIIIGYMYHFRYLSTRDSFT